MQPDRGRSIGGRHRRLRRRLHSLLGLLGGVPDVAFPPIVVAVHLPPASEYLSRLREVLQQASSLPVDWAVDGGPVLAGRVHLAPQDVHTGVTAAGRFRMVHAPCRPRPGVDHLFGSVADACGERAFGVVLSGCLSDGASGSRRILDGGGTVIVQDRASAFRFDMPRASLTSGPEALVMPPSGILAAIHAMSFAPGMRSWFRVHAGSAYAATV